MKKARPWKQTTPAWVESDARVVDARRKWERGEITYGKMTRVRHIVAGICVKCSSIAVRANMCERHAAIKHAKTKLSEKRRRDRIRIEKNTRAGIPLTMHSVKSCSKCGTLRKTAATCDNGVHR